MKGRKEKELDDLKHAIEFAMEKHKVGALVIGTIASQYWHGRIKKLADELKIDVFSPLWKIDGEEYLDELVKAKFTAVIISIAGEGLTKEMLGKKIDSRMIQRLKEISQKTGMHIAAEAGEYDSIVLDCPMFRKKIKIIESAVEIDDEHTGRLVIKKVELAEK